MRRFVQIVLIALPVSAVCAAFNHGLNLMIEIHQRWSLFILFLPVVLFVTRGLEKRIRSIEFSSAFSEKYRALSSRETLLDLMLLPFCWMSHLAGASVGRESAAVQLGRSVAQIVGNFLSVADWQKEAELLSRIGIACGFSAVFGAPWAAVVFAFEWHIISEEKWQGQKSIFAGFSVPTVLSCGLASGLAFVISTDVLFVRHNSYIPTAQPMNFRWFIFLIVMFFSTFAFSRLYQMAKNGFLKAFSFIDSIPLLRIVLPALLLMMIFQFSGADKYKGLGLNLIEPILLHGNVDGLSLWDSAGKGVMTAFSVSAGFKGGEFTPLLAMGAAGGAAVGSLLGIAAPAAAAVGFVLLVGCALNISLTCAVLSLECFGLNGGASGAVLCCVLSAVRFVRLSRE